MKRKLKEVVRIERGMKTYNSDYQPNNINRIELIPISIDDIPDYRITGTLNTEPFIPDEQRPKVYLEVDKKYKNIGIQEGDILMPVTSSELFPKYINFTNRKFVYRQKMLVIKTNALVLLPKYLFYILINIKTRNWLLKNSLHNPYGLPILSAKVLYELEIEVPSIEEQQNFINKMEQLDKEKVDLLNTIV